MSKKIFIDAGHGGTDPGAVNGNRQEKNDNLNFSLALSKRLKECGFDVSQSRTTDVSVTLEERTKKANNWKADLFISVHRNSFSNPSANGIEAWIYTHVDQNTKAIAGKIYNEIVNIYSQSKRGVKQGDFYVLRATAMPAVLLELGFISNAVDNSKFDEHFNRYVEAVCKGVCNYYGVKYKPGQPASELPPAGKLYKVQTGAFREKSNAQNLVKKLKDAGFDAFVVEI